MPGEKIMYKRAALRDVAEVHFRKEEVVIDHIRAVADLDEQVLRLAVEADVAVEMRALRLPVEPYGAVAAIEHVVVNLRIERGVELDARNLRAVVRLLMVDMVDAVAVNLAEHGAQMADDGALLALINLIIADDMAADMRFVPVAVHGAEDDLLLALRSEFEFQVRPLVVAR